MVTYFLLLIAAIVATFAAFRRPRMFPVFLLTVGTLRFGAEGAGVGVNLSALWLAGLIFLTAVLLLWVGGRRWRLAAPEGLYALFLIWCLLEAFRADSLEYSVRVFLKLLYPFLVMVLAHQAMLSAKDFRTAVKWILAASFVASLFVGGLTQRLLPAVCMWAGRSVVWAFAAYADHAALMTVLALVAWRMFRRNGYLVLALWFASSSVLAGIRTGIGATAIGVSLFVVLTSRKAAAIPILMGVYLAAAVSLFVLPEAKEYMFRNPASIDTRQAVLRPDTLSTNDIEDHGRFELWGDILDRFFRPNPLLGSGLGTTQAWLYSRSRTAAGPMVEHSSYVRLLADTGLIGLALWAATALCCMLSGWQIYRRGASREIRLCGLYVVCAFPALMFCMGFDNLINYALPGGQYPFAFTGLALGLAHRSAVAEALVRRSRRPDSIPQSRTTLQPARAE